MLSSILSQALSNKISLNISLQLSNRKYLLKLDSMWLLLKSDTAIQRYSDTGTGTWNRNLEPCIIYAN